MYICVCKGVTDRQIRQALKSGCHSLRDLRDHLGVASQCGKCACHAQQLVRAHHAAEANTTAILHFPLLPATA